MRAWILVLLGAAPTASFVFRAAPHRLAAGRSHSYGPVACTTRDSDDDLKPPELFSIPRLTTPEREGFRNFRERQRERSSGQAGSAPAAENLPLGFEPVLGEARDLRKEDGEPRAPTPDEVAEAEAEFQQMLGGPAQRFKASLEKIDDLDIGGAVDDLLA